MALYMMGSLGLQLLNFSDGPYQEIYAEGRGITQERFQALEAKWERERVAEYGVRSRRE